MYAAIAVNRGIKGQLVFVDDAIEKRRSRRFWQEKQDRAKCLRLLLAVFDWKRLSRYPLIRLILLPLGKLSYKDW